MSAIRSFIRREPVLLIATLAHTLCERAGSVRLMGLLLVLLCFFSAMLIMII